MFYALKEHNHQTDKKFCLHLEYEPEREEFEEKLEDSYGIKDFNKDITMLGKVDPEWCERCAMFAEATFPKFWIVDSIGFHHSYSNPIIQSKWYFYNIFMGSSHTDFCNRFNPDHGYREVSMSDINFTEYQYEQFGTAYRSIDREAIQETKEVMDFCKKWLNQENIKVIYVKDI